MSMFRRLVLRMALNLKVVVSSNTHLQAWLREESVCRELLPKAAVGDVAAV